MSAIRILLVDDFPQWQRFLRTRFESEHDLTIIAVANDGLEGLQKATELQPDLVLMDLRMPIMNGLEATRRICQVSPNSRILFITESSCRDLVAAAFEAGSCGYILKSDCGADLLTGIRAILAGKQFVSRSLRAENWQ